MLSEQLVHGGVTTNETECTRDKAYIYVYKNLQTNPFYTLKHAQACRPPLTDPCDMNVGAGTQGWNRITQQTGSSGSYTQSNSPEQSHVIV